jgi:hypothetical protein
MANHTPIQPRQGQGVEHVAEPGLEPQRAALFLSLELDPEPHNNHAAPQHWYGLDFYNEGF